MLADLYAQAPAEVWGFDVAQRTGLKGGSLYPVFRRLEEAGLVESRWEEWDSELERPRRRYYRLTPDGVAFCRARIVEQRPVGEGIWDVVR